MTKIHRARGALALLLSMLLILCILSFGRDVYADTSSSAGLDSVWGDGATVYARGSGYEPNSTFTVTVNFSMSVGSVSSTWGSASSATNNGSSVTLTVTADGNGNYNAGFNISAPEGVSYVEYWPETKTNLTASSGGTTGSAAKAPEPAKPGADKPGKPAEENKPAAPADNKPAAPAAQDNKPAAQAPADNKPAAAEPAAPKETAAAQQTQATTAPTKAPSNNSSTTTTSTTTAPTKAPSNNSGSTNPTKAPSSSKKPTPTPTPKKTEIITSSTELTDETTATTKPTEPSKAPEDENTTEEAAVAAVAGSTGTNDNGAGGNGTDAAVVDGQAVDGADETESTEDVYVRHSIKGLVNASPKKSGGWLKFFLILLVIGIGARLAVLKTNGVDNSDLLIEFFPIKAIKKKFRPEPEIAPATESASDTKVVNGYLQKSNTAAVRPVYSNAASASSSRVRQTSTAAKAPVKRPSSIKTMTAADKAATPRKTTTAAKPSSGNTAFNHAQAMKELRAMSESDGLGAGAPTKK